MPKTAGSLFPLIIDFNNLNDAAIECERRRRYLHVVMNFNRDYAFNLYEIQAKLISHSWHPMPYRKFKVYEPKERYISAPAFQDRIVHHALVRQVEGIFERKFLSCSYACRKGMGTHACAAATEADIRKAWALFNGGGYVIKGDISRYFYSVNLPLLKEAVRRTIRCPDTLWLFDAIIGSCECGLPIGALTSQLLANINLDPFDHWIKETLQVRFYRRYMDDFSIICATKRDAQALLGDIERYFNTKLKLQLNPKSAVYPLRHGIDFCGYRIFPTHKLPRKRNINRMRRKLHMLETLLRGGRIEIQEAWQSLASYRGYLRHCESKTTFNNILNDIPFIESEVKRAYGYDLRTS